MPLFTRETAREMGRRGNVARWSRPQETAAPAPLPAPIAETEPDFAAVRLSRVRQQLNKVDAALAKETDPLSIERLARASAALNAQEFALAGRPMPGSLRPTAAAARKSADYRNTLQAPASPALASNPFRRAG